MLAVLAVVFLRGKPIDPAEDVLWQQLRQRALSSPDDPAAWKPSANGTCSCGSSTFGSSDSGQGCLACPDRDAVVAVACFAAAAQLRQRLVLPGEPQFLEYQERQERAEAPADAGSSPAAGGSWWNLAGRRFCSAPQWERLAKSLASRGNQLGQVAGSEVASAKREPAIAAPAGTARETTEAATAGNPARKSPGKVPSAQPPLVPGSLAPKSKKPSGRLTAGTGLVFEGRKAPEFPAPARCRYLGTCQQARVFFGKPRFRCLAIVPPWSGKNESS